MAPIRGLEVEVRGLRDFQRELRRLSAELPRELREANLRVAQLIEAAVQRGNLSKQQAEAIEGVIAAAQQRFATIAFDPRRVPFVRGAFFGAKRYPQFPEWVGNQWEPGAGGGPYVVADEIRSNFQQIIDVYGELIEELAARAFPSGTHFA